VIESATASALRSHLLNTKTFTFSSFRPTSYIQVVNYSSYLSFCKSCQQPGQMWNFGRRIRCVP